jgi:hypothetical protein
MTAVGTGAMLIAELQAAVIASNKHWFTPFDECRRPGEGAGHAKLRMSLPHLPDELRAREGFADALSELGNQEASRRRLPVKRRVAPEVAYK